MVRAGRGAGAAGAFQVKGVVAIGWYGVDWTKCADLSAIKASLKQQARDKSERQIITAAGQIERFLRGIQIGDGVITHDAEQRVFLLGIVEGPPKFSPLEIEELPTQRPVKWESSTARTSLSGKTLNSLGAISTLFLVGESAADELRSNAEPL